MTRQSATSTRTSARSVKDPHGCGYDVFVYNGYGVSGAAFLAADEGAPGVVNIIAKLVNRALRRLPRKPTSYTYPVVYVLRHTEVGGARQVQTTHTSTRAEAATVIADIVKRIQDGTFMPDERNGL